MKKQIVTKDIEGNLLEINIHNDKYFSITCSAYEKGKTKSDRNMVYGGCAHDEILKARPDLKLLVDLHLSDSLGQPMYALENGFYFYKIAIGIAQYHKKEEGDFTKYSRVLSEHLRINLSETLKLIDILNQLPENERKLEFASFVRTQLERWKNESIQASELINNL